MRKKLTLLFALLCVSMMSWAYTTNPDTWLGSSDATYNSQFKWYTIDGVSAPSDVVSIQKPGWSEEIGIYTNKDAFNKVTFNDEVKTNGTHYHQDGAGVILFISALTAENTEVKFYNNETLLWGLRIYNDKAGSSTPAVTGICATSTYTSNVAGYDIHAQVTKGCNKYYLTLTSATEGKTLTSLVGDNMFCARWCDEARTQGLGNYHMAASGHYTISEGAITFVIPSVGDPQMYTPLNVRFSDNTACEISALNGVRLVPCASAAPAACPDPEPSIINDVNFALQAQGSVAYASSGNAGAGMDGNNGSRWESTHGVDPQTWTLDMGQRRIFNTIQIRWESSYARVFSIEISNDESSWTEIVSETNYTEGGDNVEYEKQFDVDKTARYVRFTGTTRASIYGYSFYEFRVIHATTPVLTTYTASVSSPFCPLGSNYLVSVAAKDQLGNDFPVETTFSVSPVGAGTITSAGVYTPSVVGVATITANGGGMSSSVTVHNEVSADLALNKTATAGYSAGDAFSAAKANNNNLGDRWGSEGATHPDQDWWYVDLGAKYDISEIAINWQTARPNDYDIRVSDDASSWTNIGVFDSYPAENAYEYYNSLSSIPGRYVGVWARNGYASLAYGISIWDFKVFGTENVSANKYVSATASPAAGGSVTVQAGGIDVTEVPSGTEVTFTATPNSGYDFINWTQGGVEVSTSATYVATITSNTALVANFETHRTAYCAAPVSDTQGRTLYLTISRTENANEYKILFEGSEENRITNTNVYVGTGLRLRNVNGVSEYHFSNGDGIWHVSSDGFGSAYVTFTATNFRDISFVNKGVDLYRNMSYGTGGDLSSFNAFPDAYLIKWDATCTDEEAPVLAAPTATPLSGTSVRLAVSATDDMAALLTYNVNYKPEGDAGAGTDLEFNGTAGAVTYKNIKGLSAGVRYQFSVTVSDGTNTSAAQVCYAKPSMPTAPVPTHNANLVRSVYSDKYESALAHDFIKNNWNWIPYTPQSIGGDNFLVYTSNPEEQEQMPNVAWGDNNDGANAIIAKDGFNDGTNKGLDVREMQYIHFDMWSAVATIYPQIALNDDVLGFFRLNGTGWQSFDLPLSTLTEDKLNNIRWIAFGGFRDPNPEEIAIDNVYFWSEGVQTTPVMGGDDATGGWATFSSSSKVSVPSGVTAYKAVYSNVAGDEQLELEDIGSVIPANEGVLVRGDADHAYIFPHTDADAPTITDNMLVGCPVRTDITSVAATNDIFCLRYSDIFQITGFYLYSGQYIAAGKAYLPLPKAAPSSAPRRLRFVFREEQGTTGFDPTNAEAVPTTKFMENGQIYIQRGDAVYTIQGVRVK